MKAKAAMWVFLVAGLWWLLVGLRDMFAPGFFSPAGRAVSGSALALDFSLSAVCMALAVILSGRARRLKSGGGET